MASKFVKVLAGIFSIIFGVGIAYFWQTLRPDDSFDIVIGVGIVGVIASFISVYFLTKGSGGD